MSMKNFNDTIGNRTRDLPTCSAAPPGAPIHIRTFSKAKVKRSHYRSGQAHRVPESWDSKVSRQSAHEGDKIVSPTHRPPLPSRKYSWYLFLLEAESTPGPEYGRKDSQWKIPITLGIEPATFLLVVQCLNQLRHQQHAPHTFSSDGYCNIHGWSILMNGFSSDIAQNPYLFALVFLSQYRT